MTYNVTAETVTTAQPAFTEQSSSSASSSPAPAVSEATKKAYEKCDVAQQIISIFTLDTHAHMSTIVDDNFFKVIDVARFLLQKRNSVKEQYEQCVTAIANDASSQARKIYCDKKVVELFLSGISDHMEKLENGIEKFRKTIVSVCENETEQSIKKKTGLKNRAASFDELVDLYFDYSFNCLKPVYVDYIAKEICNRSKTTTAKAVVRACLELLAPSTSACSCAIM